MRQSSFADELFALHVSAQFTWTAPKRADVARTVGNRLGFSYAEAGLFGQTLFWSRNLAQEL